MRTASFLLALCMMFSSCLSSTLIDSVPTDAHIYADGYYMGKTPIVYEDLKVAGSTTLIVIKKEGYSDLETLIYKDEKFDVAACGGALFFVVPVLWIMGYDSQHTYKLEPIPGYVEEEELEIEQEEEIIQEEESPEQEEETDEQEDNTEEEEKEKPKEDLPDEEDVDNE